MKKIFTVSILIFVLLTPIYSQETTNDYAKEWLSSTKQEKEYMITGFILGLLYVSSDIRNIPTGNLKNRDVQNYVAEIYRHEAVLFSSESAEFWISALDTFYLKNGNNNVYLHSAFINVVEDYKAYLNKIGGP